MFLFVHIPPIFSVLLTYSLKINSLLFLTHPVYYCICLYLWQGCVFVCNFYGPCCLRQIINEKLWQCSGAGVRGNCATFVYSLSCRELDDGSVRRPWPTRSESALLAASAAQRSPARPLSVAGSTGAARETDTTGHRATPMFRWRPG